eukprot:TRINITY_DN54780_c0_g1_i1.p1 TRINITY_DN54780_c0_g1~~TRINITY_DN54780_c0_g1_i1.p1  ORF type:complete len:427 (+),score=35.13 TRINITY_DN54780_c0_g1_i1:40-1320(+)
MEQRRVNSLLGAWTAISAFQVTCLAAGATTASPRIRFVLPDIASLRKEGPWVETWLPYDINLTHERFHEAEIKNAAEGARKQDLASAYSMFAMPGLLSPYFSACRMLTRWMKRLWTHPVELQMKALLKKNKFNEFFLRASAHLDGASRKLKKHLNSLTKRVPEAGKNLILLWSERISEHLREIALDAVKDSYDQAVEAKYEESTNIWHSLLRVTISLTLTVYWRSFEILLLCLPLMAKIPWPPKGLIFRGDLVMTINTRWELLVHLVRQLGKPHPRVVEIGVADGTTSQYALDAGPNITLLGVDPYQIQPGSYALTRNMYLGRCRAGVQRCRLAHMTSEAASYSEHLKRSGWDEIDVLFVDGAHDYENAYTDIKLWMPRVGKVGCVAGHDFSPGWPGVGRAVFELTPHDVQLQAGPEGTWWWCRGI